MEGRPVRESVSEYAELALPNDTNALGTLLGGKVMHLVDLAGAMAAMRHARSMVVTASIDYMTFLHPVRVGQLVISALLGQPGLPHVHGSGSESLRGGPDHRRDAPHLFGLPDLRGDRRAGQPRAGGAR